MVGRNEQTVYKPYFFHWMSLLIVILTRKLNLWRFFKWHAICMYTVCVRCVDFILAETASTWAVVDLIAWFSWCNKVLVLVILWPTTFLKVSVSAQTGQNVATHQVVVRWPVSRQEELFKLQDKGHNFSHGHACLLQEIKAERSHEHDAMSLNSSVVLHSLDKI